MGSATEWVRRALAELGPDAPDQEVKAYIRGKDSSVPEGHVSLALRKLRGKMIPTGRKQSRTKQPCAKPSQGDLFPE
jgi:hypothetical protein